MQFHPTFSFSNLVFNLNKREIATLLLFTLFILTASAQTNKDKSKKTWKEKVQFADSLRLQMRRASEDGRLLLWGDSLRRTWKNGESFRQEKDSIFRQRLSRYDNFLHTGDSILKQRYQKVNFDTTYIMRPPGRWTIKVRGNLTGASFDVRGMRDGNRFQTHVESKSWGTVSMAVSYRGLTAGFAINPLKLAGLNKDYELNTNSYGNRFGFDVVFLSSKTYEGTTSYNEHETPIEKGSVSQKALNLNCYYAFNAKKFSFPAAFSQSYIQRKSAGSLIIGASLDGQITDVATNVSSGVTNFKLKLLAMGLGIGYGYNFVAKRHWLFHLSVLPAFNLYIHSHVNEDGQRINMRYRFPSLITTERGAIVYSWRNKFVVATMVFNYSVVGDKNHLQVTRDKWRMRITYGFRF